LLTSATMRPASCLRVFLLRQIPRLAQRPLPENPELARLVADAREIDRRYNEELGRRVRQLSDEELGQFVSYLMRTREPDDDDEEAEDE
jgi:hypothetical protein